MIKELYVTTVKITWDTITSRGQLPRTRRGARGSTTPEERESISYSKGWYLQLSKPVLVLALNYASDRAKRDAVGLAVPERRLR